MSIKWVGDVAIKPKHRLSCHCGSVVLEQNLPDGIVNPRRLSGLRRRSAAWKGSIRSWSRTFRSMMA